MFQYIFLFIYLKTYNRFIEDYPEVSTDRQPDGRTLDDNNHRNTRACDECRMSSIITGADFRCIAPRCPSHELACTSPTENDSV